MSSCCGATSSITLQAVNLQTVPSKRRKSVKNVLFYYWWHITSQQQEGDKHNRVWRTHADVLSDFGEPLQKERSKTRGGSAKGPPPPKSDREHKHDKAMLVGVPDQILQENNHERPRNVFRAEGEREEERQKMDKKTEHFGREE